MRPRISEKSREETREMLSESLRELDRRDLVREDIIRLSRELIRCSGRLTSRVVSGDYRELEKEVESCRGLVRDLLRHTERDPDLVRGGVALQAFIEYCEATYLIYYTLGVDMRCDKTERGVPVEAVLLGVLDMTGELKRIAIDALGDLDIETTEKILGLMKTIYDVLRGTDYPDAIAPGYRHKIDVLRRNIEDLETMFSDVKTRKMLIERIGEKRGS